MKKMYKLYHADKFSLWPEDYIQEEGNNMGDEDEFSKMVDLPLLIKNYGDDNKKKEY